MPSSLRLDILRDLRERAGLTQSDMARLCGLYGQQSYQTAGAWERGEIVPNRTRRQRFIGYLWDHLGLGKDPAQFEAVWAMLVEEWDWEPITDSEWASFTHQPRPLRRMSPVPYSAYLNRVGKPPALPPARVEHTLTMRYDQQQAEEAYNSLLVWLLTHLSLFGPDKGPDKGRDKVPDKAQDKTVWYEVRLLRFE